MRLKPLWVDAGNVLSYNNGKVASNDLKGIKMPIGTLKGVMARLRIMARFLRTEPRTCCHIAESRWLLCLNHQSYMIDTAAGSVSQLSSNREGWSDPLNFCRVDNVVYWGEYGPNPEYDEVVVYRYDGKNVSEAYRFPANTVRHIHNIVHDRDTGRIWILTGDNEEHAGIYHTDDSFGSVVPFATGEQRFRAVVAFPHEGGLLYATDSVTDDNFIYLLSSDKQARMVCPLNGSCIYGTELKDYFVFSTTVESPEGRGLSALLSRKLGSGIKSRRVDVVAVSKHDLSCRVVASYVKDAWPYKLFQYGCVQFPTGQEFSNRLVMSPVAVKKFDGRTVTIDLDKT